MAHKVLIVDDEETSRKLVRAVLDPEKFETHMAVNGKDALAIMEESQFDLIILDVEMPEMNGYDVCNALRFDDKFKSHWSTPIVLLTSRVQEIPDDVSRSQDIEYLSKPVSKDTLMGKIKLLLT